MIIQTPDEVTAQFDAEQAEKLGNTRYEPTPLIDALADHVKQCWSQAQHNRQVTNNRLMKCLRARRGEYDPDKMAAIRSMGGSTIYMRITSEKCAAARAWISDVFTSGSERPWTLSPTPVVDLPPKFREQLLAEAVQGAMMLGVGLDDMHDLVQKHEDRIKAELQDEATTRCERMADKIQDVMVEGHWREEFDSFLDDLVTYPVAIFKGPIYRRTKTVKWVDVGEGEFEPKSEYSINREFRRVSPFDFFISPAATAITDDWCIERHRLTAADLAAMRGAAGYNGQGIAMALTEYRLGGLREWLSTDSERERLESKDSAGNDTLIDALEWSGKLQGQMLLDWGMSPESIPDPLDEYLVSVMTVGAFCIRALVNPDPTDRNDYFSATWRSVPNSFMGEALPEMLSDCQSMCNATARALANNMGIASGPMVYYSADRLAPGQDVTNLHPWKIFGVTESRTGSTAVPVGFFQPSSNAQELMAIYERFTRYAGDITGLPSYAYGSDQAAGAGRTASGLSMMMNAASKTMKQVVRSIDIGVVEPCIRKVFNHLMLDPRVDSALKGDAQIRAIGSDSILYKENTQMMQQQFLAQTNNPVDMQIIGLEGRRELLREVSKSLDVPVDRIVPSTEELELRQMEMMAQQVQQEQQQGPSNAE